MPKPSEIDLRPNDILLCDVPDEALAELRRLSAALSRPFGALVLDRLASHFELPRGNLASATVIVLDPE